MSWIYFCSCSDTSSAMNVWPWPSPSWLDSFLSSIVPIIPPPPTRRVDDAVGWWTPPLQGWTDPLICSNYPSIRFLHIALKIKGMETHFPESDGIIYCSTFCQKIDVTCWIFSPGLILHQSQLQLGFGHKAVDDSNKQGLFFSALECLQFLLFCSCTDLSCFTVTHSTVVWQK